MHATLQSVESGATDLVTGQTDTNANLDVFVFNRTTGATTLASRTAASATTTGNDFSFNPQVSGNGNAVVYQEYDGYVGN